MKIIISDACTLILLQKIDLLDSIANMHELLIPERVFEEAVTIGKQRRHPDAFMINEQIAGKKITVVKVQDGKAVMELVKGFNVGFGEAEAIVLYGEKKADLLAIDDHRAINICRIRKIRFVTALSFVLYLNKSKRLSKETARDKIEKLFSVGRYKDHIITEALDMLVA